MNDVLIIVKCVQNQWRIISKRHELERQRGSVFQRREDELIFLRKLLESKEKEINELKEKINELYSESIEISVVSDESNVEEAKETTEINETTVDTENGC